ncbi:Aspartic proteinase yapsin-6 [Fusarium oxysporum f. sp. albedinis]|nr:Aspartic proteinase yapsin-6 [Fusarium oxysporum f. sp. albedinis]
MRPPFSEALPPLSLLTSANLCLLIVREVVNESRPCMIIAAPIKAHCSLQCTALERAMGPQDPYSLLCVLGWTPRNPGDPPAGSTTRLRSSSLAVLNESDQKDFRSHYL